MKTLDKIVGAGLLVATGMLGVKGDFVRSVFGMEKVYDSKPAVYATSEPETPKEPPAVNPEPAKEPTGAPAAGTPPGEAEAPKEPPKAEPAEPPAVNPEEPAKEPPKDVPKEEPKVEAKPYVATYRVEIAEGLGGMARAYLSALIDSRKEYNKTADKKQYVPETKAGEIALLMLVDKDKNNQVSPSELEEACNNEKLNITVKYGEEDYLEATIELPSIKESSPEAARLDAVRELMKKAGDERKFLFNCEQYNTVLAIKKADGTVEFNLPGLEKYAQKAYGAK